MTQSPDGTGRPARRLVVADKTMPALARHIRLRMDETRQQWVLLAPERLLTPSETAVAVLKLCNGTRTVAAIAAELAAEFDAPEADILADILPLLQELADQSYLTA